MIPPDRREGRGGDPPGGARDDPGCASARAVGLGDRPAAGARPQEVRKDIERGLALPACGPRQPRSRVVRPFEPYLQERIAAFPELTGSRLLREIGRGAGGDPLRPHEERGAGRGGGPGHRLRSQALDLAAHYRFLPKACRPYRATTKGKVEPPFRYVREDFFLLANEIRILEDDKPIAVHPVFEGRGRRRIAGGHRTPPPPANSTTVREALPPTAPAGAVITPRSPAFCDAVYDAVARRLAGEGGRASEAMIRSRAPSTRCAATWSGSGCRGRSRSSIIRCANANAARSAPLRRSTEAID